MNRRTLSEEFVQYNKHLRTRLGAWGFYVLRPSTLTADETQWALALSRLREYILRPFQDDDDEFQCRTGAAPDTSLARLIAETLLLPVLDVPMNPHQSAHHEPSLANITPHPLLEAARETFDNYVLQYRDAMEERDATALDSVHWDGGILVDDTTLKELCSPAADGVAGGLCVIILDRRPEEGELQQHRYGGWMYATVSALRTLYQDLETGSVYDWCPRPKFKGQLSLYDGNIDGKLIRWCWTGPGRHTEGTRVIFAKFLLGVTRYPNSCRPGIGEKFVQE